MYSVIMPLLNKAPHLGRAMESVLSQTGPVFELVIVDDGSTDGSRETTEGYARRDSRVRMLLRNEAGPGGYAARNLGAQEARFPWLGFPDADDEWKPGFLAEIGRVRGVFPQARFVSAAYVVVERNGTVRLGRFAVDRIGSPAQLVPTPDFPKAARKGRWLAHTSSVFTERAALLELAGFPEGCCARGGDRDTWLRLIMSVPCAWTPFIGAAYRTDSVNMVTRNTPYPLEPCPLVTIREILDQGGSDVLSSGVRRELVLLRLVYLVAWLRRKWKAGEFGSADFGRLLHTLGNWNVSRLSAAFSRLPEKREVGK